MTYSNSVNRCSLHILNFLLHVTKNEEEKKNHSVFHCDSSLDPAAFPHFLHITTFFCWDPSVFSASTSPYHSAFYLFVKVYKDRGCR